MPSYNHCHYFHKPSRQSQLHHSRTKSLLFSSPIAVHRPPRNKPLAQQHSRLLLCSYNSHRIS